MPVADFPILRAMKTIRRFLVFSALAALPLSGLAAKQLTVKAVNQLSLARPAQTLELPAKDLEPLGERDLARIHVKDAAGKEVLCQAVDTDYDAYHTPDIVIYQADFAPNETKTFTVFKGAKQEFTRDQFKAFGRFARERFDDFAWENDRIAHRTYGKALETWEGEPLCSSTIDIWSKRTPRMVINEWYMLDNYHEDIGEGFDDYSAGLSRGDGGNGLWAADQLWVSRNFVNSRVLANGPIRVMFELTYEPFNVNGISVAEVKRIALDAGQNLDHYQSFYKPYTRPGHGIALTTGIGLKKVKGEQVEFSADHGWLLSWQDMEKNAGKQGVAVVADPKLIEKQTEDKLNNLMLVKVPADDVASYWVKASPFTNSEAWRKYVDDFAQGLQSPIEVKVTGP